MTCSAFALLILLCRSTFAFEENVPTIQLHDAAEEGLQQTNGDRERVAVCITLLNEGKESLMFVDGAAVLAYSIRRLNSKFDYDFYAIVTPQVTKSRTALQKYGYRILDGKVPINISAIPNTEYRKLLPKSGCCGETEFIKLEAFKLTQYVKVVMLDADSIVFKNIDSVIEDPTDAIWTVDRYLGGKCINGGFLVAKPSVEVYNHMMAWAQQGLFYYGGRNVPRWGGTAWNGTGIGYCYGGQTFQGIVPFYYQGSALKSSHSWKEEDSQMYNNMGSTAKTVKGKIENKANPEEVRTAHFTNCQKPWKCHGFPYKKGDFCSEMHKRWWMIRAEYETSLGSPPVKSCEIGKPYVSLQTQAV